MSLPDPTRRRLFLALAGAAGAALLPGCTARPLYATGGVEAGTASARPDIIVKPATSRVELEMRNHLVYLLTGGGPEPTEAAYTFQATVFTVDTPTVTVQRTIDAEPSSGQVIVVARYSIIDNKTGAAVAAGARSTVASYDAPRQVYASVRASRDAENRAARELAETLRVVIAQELIRAKAAT